MQKRRPIQRQRLYDVKSDMKLIDLFKLKAVLHNIKVIQVLDRVYNGIFSASELLTARIYKSEAGNVILCTRTLSSTRITYNVLFPNFHYIPENIALPRHFIY
jgi:hypothetical protein